VDPKYLIVVAGPTGIGKTDIAIQLATHLRAPIISGDSRQIFRELKIGTAAPSKEQLHSAPHYLIGTHSVTEYYSAFEFEQDVLNLLKELYLKHNVAILAGGSMMYIDAVCNGIDELPTVDTELRNQLLQKFNDEGIDSIRRLLKQLDPEFYAQVDLKNHKRVLHAVEICLMAGKPYSSLRTKTKTERPFKIIKIGLDMERDALYQRINDRVDKMFKDGLIDEAQQVFHLRQLNSLNTVGYKELFQYFEGNITMAEAHSLIQQNSRRYAKRQLSWFRRDSEMTWFHPADCQKIITFVKNSIHHTERPGA
jgi:tRNA dimethylallyltransferase